MHVNVDTGEVNVSISYEELLAQVPEEVLELAHLRARAEKYRQIIVEIAVEERARLEATEDMDLIP